MNWLSQLADSASFGHVLAQFEADLQSPGFWLALGKIVWINVLLSGDNALVIALACRGLHGKHRFWGMVAGSGIAVALRIAFTGIVATLMALPYLKLIGGLALIVIAAKLLVPEDENDEIAAGTTLWHAVRIVALADLVMSLDNVIAVAAAANGQASLLIIGLAMSIPLIIAGAALIMLVLDRVPVLVWLGAMLLGWVAGEVIATDPAIEPMLHHLLDGTVLINIEATSALFAGKTNLASHVDVMETLMSLIGAGVVLIAGSIWRGRALQRQAETELQPVPARGVDLP
ncbi:MULTISPECIES: TerC family protein [unclassified Bradyrhizobium]|uniref:TerC family protein n=1 Tax=unclassified Bradyrhizobium TaxID=2631580 RepID=UPI0029163A3B|nr:MULTISPECIES: TerC family protein [unclassified Bradyrhizobium]